MSDNKELIDKIRVSFMSEAQKNSGLYHKLDVERVQSQDWPIERFVLVTKSEEAALKALIKAMQWRKTFGVNDFTDDYFPEEVYKIGFMMSFSKDKENRPLVWSQTKCYHKCGELGQMLKQFIVYQYEKIDRQTSHQGWAIVVDTTNAGLSNVDLDFSKFMVEVLQSYYPRGPKYMLSVDLPWILNATSKLVMAFMAEEMKSLTKFIKKAELLEYIAPEYIPVHLNGSYDKSLIIIPDGVKPLGQLSHTKFTADQIKKVYSAFKAELK